VQVSQDPIEIRSRRSDPNCDNPSLLNQATAASGGGFAAASAGGRDACNPCAETRRGPPFLVAGLQQERS